MTQPQLSSWPTSFALDLNSGVLCGPVLGPSGFEPVPLVGKNLTPFLGAAPSNRFHFNIPGKEAGFRFSGGVDRSLRCVRLGLNAANGVNVRQSVFWKTRPNDQSSVLQKTVLDLPLEIPYFHFFNALPQIDPKVFADHSGVMASKSIESDIALSSDHLRVDEVLLLSALARPVQNQIIQGAVILMLRKLFGLSTLSNRAVLPNHARELLEQEGVVDPYKPDQGTVKGIHGMRLKYFGGIDFSQYGVLSHMPMEGVRVFLQPIGIGQLPRLQLEYVQSADSEMAMEQLPEGLVANILSYLNLVQEAPLWVKEARPDYSRLAFA
ncbi:MAG: hypothetical protein H7A33_05930 [Deltaproteobacteria bacterium]|nr:hypothetical protein [Deltaproteobacteria bacterium]